MITINIDGIKPESQGRPRLSRFGVYSPKTDFYRAVFFHALGKKPKTPMDGPIVLACEFRFVRPAAVKSLQLLKWTRPDVDNMLKAVLDACTQARIWGDDGQVVSVSSSKVYAEQPGVTVKIWQATDPAWRPKT